MTLSSKSKDRIEMASNNKLSRF